MPRPRAASLQPASLRAGFVRVATGAALIVALLLPGAVPAAAQAGLPTLDEQLTDAVDVLSPTEETEVEAALDELLETANVQLWVLYTDTTDGSDGPGFASDVAAANSLGGNDALLMVAFDDRVYSIWVADGLDQVTDDEIDDILVNALEPELRAEDYAAAAIATADALGVAATNGTATAPPTTGPAPTAAPGGNGGGDRGGLNITPIIAIVVIGGGLFLIVRTLLMRRAAARADAEERDRLAREANRALLAVDELVRDAEEELGFAEAQWGEAEAQPFREAMTRAATELKAAFAVRQQLDDQVPDTPEQRRAMLAEIVERTGRARTDLEAQLARLEELRDLERTAPEQLAALPPAIETLRARRTAAGTLLDRLVTDYAPSAVASVRGNLVEADKALETASAETARGLGAVEPRRAEAVVALRHAQEAVAAGTRLVEAVERLGAGLDEAAAQVMPELREAEADTARARDLVFAAAAPAGAAALADDLAQAERLLGEARRSVEARPFDPLAALERTTAAHRAADAVLSGIEEAEQARQRQVALVGRSITNARARVDRAVDYITTRRHGVGQRARVRAAEAEARLADAERLAATDPAAAIEAAGRAQQLADEAYSLAASEFDGWDDRSGPVAGPYRRDPFGSPESQVIGAVLGGILGGVLSGGRGSGWGGSSWGGSGGGRSGGGGFGLPSGPRGGGWGGGGLGGGGGGSGGGGRARGGRW